MAVSTLLRQSVARIDPKAATVAGLVAGVAFLAAMEVDIRVTGRNLDDRILLGRPVVPHRPEAAKTVGTMLHLPASVAFAWLYAAVERHLPGPPWWRGVVAFNVENLVLYALTAFEGRHPAIRDGQLDRYFSFPAFVQSIPRHVAFGAVLGVLYDRLRSQPDVRR